MFPHDVWLMVFLTGWGHPADLSSPDEQSGAVCLSVGSRCQFKHTGKPRKVVNCCREFSWDFLLPHPLRVWRVKLWEMSNTVCEHYRSFDRRSDRKCQTSGKPAVTGRGLIKKKLENKKEKTSWMCSQLSKSECRRYSFRNTPVVGSICSKFRKMQVRSSSWEHQLQLGSRQQLR